MADRLTQLQDALDQLATQFYASLRYITASAPPLPSQPSTTTTTATQSQSQTSPPPTTPSATQPTAPQFALDQRELARDLILKEQQIEYLIASLPGIGTSEREQEARLRGLEGELREAERERDGVRREREEVVERLERVVGGVGRP
ncbi:MAG: RNA polymerase II mediator complex subunit [Piccolia ochrophora]|nr:MAG: RNA polymerase II mediator complex subunit [Piccolia ochrophora]